MKKLIVFLSCVILCFCMAACNVTEQGGEQQQTGVDAYGANSGNNVNYLCGIDVYGRVFEPVSGFDESKDVGMFYFLWHGESGMTTHNITELLKNDPETLFDLSINTNDFHYWGEPLFGYYRSNDEWVVRRHIEMLINAGIDYLIFDTTNGFVYSRSCNMVLDVLTEYQQQGWDVPLFCFYTNSHSCNTVTMLYKNIYKSEKYKSLWYCPKGDKPMIITDTDDPAFKNSDVLEHFDVRESQWPDAQYISDGVPWMEWNYPQPLHADGYMNVSVAQHPNLPFSASITDRGRNWGRGYDFQTRQNVEEDSRKGTNFQSQWNTALNNSKVTNVFVTGWNEWIAQKLNVNNELFFVDCATEEFSRDIEPMKGGYEDSFYLQLCDNVRRFKGLTEQVRKPAKATINVNGDMAQWNNVTSIYKAVSSNSIERSSTSVDRKIKYNVSAARNNVQQVKIANDANKIYFMVQAQSNMQSVDSADFVNIYFGVGNLELKGWNGYEFVISCGDKALYALDASGKREKIADVEVAAKGNSAVASVDMSLIKANDQEGIYFKVTDGVTSTDIMDTYVDGKCMPMGRLSYYYYFG